MPRRAQPTKAAAGAPRPPPPASWAIVTYVSNDEQVGYYLDSVYTGPEDGLGVEVEAARRAVALPGFHATFAARVSGGARALAAPQRRGEKKPKFDVWLYTRNFEGFREYETKFVRCPPAPPGQPPGAARDGTLAPAPPPPGEEWEKICLERGWMRFALPGGAAPPSAASAPPGGAARA